MDRSRSVLHKHCRNRLALVEIEAEGPAIAARHSEVETLQIAANCEGPHGVLDVEELNRVMPAARGSLHNSRESNAASWAFLLPIRPNMMFPASAFRLDRPGKKHKLDVSC